MDIKSPQNNKGKEMSNPMIRTNPSIVSPVKEHGKIKLGFRGFKIVNSNIKLVKQVDVKTSVLKQKTSSEVGTVRAHVASHEHTSDPVKKISTADALRHIRENIQSRKKAQKDGKIVEDDRKETSPLSAEFMANGIHEKSNENIFKKDFEQADENLLVNSHSKNDSEKSSVKIPTEHFPKTEPHGCGGKSSPKRAAEEELDKSPVKIHSDRDKSKTNPTKSDKEIVTARHSSSKTESKHRAEHSSSSRSHSYRHYDSRKNRERSRSPYRDKESSSSKGNSNGSTRSYRSTHHSRKREKTYARKYSASSDSRERENIKSHSSRHQSDRRRLDEDSKHHRRSSNHRKPSPERTTSSSKPSGRPASPLEVVDIATSKKDEDLLSSSRKNCKPSDLSLPLVSDSEENVAESQTTSEKPLCQGESSKCNHDEGGLLSDLLDEFTSINDSSELETIEEKSDPHNCETEINTTPPLTPLPLLSEELEEDEERNNEDLYTSEKDDLMETDNEAEELNKSCTESVEENVTSADDERNDFQDRISDEDQDNAPQIASFPNETPFETSSRRNLETVMKDTPDPNPTETAPEESGTSIEQQFKKWNSVSPSVKDNCLASLLPTPHLLPEAELCPMNRDSENSSPKAEPYSMKGDSDNSSPKAEQYSITGDSDNSSPKAKQYLIKSDSKNSSIAHSPIAEQYLINRDSENSSPKAEQYSIKSESKKTSPKADQHSINPDFKNSSPKVERFSIENDSENTPAKAEQYLTKSKPENSSTSLGNKIPTLASKLKNVFESLLKTDFKADAPDGSMQALEFRKLNGVKLQNKSKLGECRDSGDVVDSSSEAVESANKNENQTSCTGKAQAADPKNGNVLHGTEEQKEKIINFETMPQDTEKQNEKIPNFESRLQEMNEESKKTSNFESRLQETEERSEKIPTFGSPEQNNSVTVNKNTIMSVTQPSPDKGCRVSLHGYKLKLHATTKTPLPAKKSYIQQVQSDSEICQSSFSYESELFSLAAKLMPVSDNEVRGISAASDARMVDNAAKNEAELGSSLLQEKDAEIADSHCEQNAMLDAQNAPVNQALPRQDSSGSSANDADDGPRRSARIRTKKSEKILKKHFCEVEHPLGQNLEVNAEGVADDTINSSSATAIEPVRVPKDSSKEEIFKVGICLAPDVTDCCPEPFDLLEENLYLTSIKKSRARKEIRRMVCECALEENPDPDGPCGGNCLNRLLMIECSSRCLYDERCSNKRFQHRKYAPTEVFKTSYKGWGIRAATDINPGELVMEYCGEVVDQREFTKRSMEYSKSNHAHFYFMALSQDEFIDATYKGNSSRFINHSCDPNAETQKWTVNGRLRVGFFTLRTIEKGEEITFDYQFERYGKVAQKCYCGTTKCRGYLGKAPDKDDENDTKVSRLLSNEALSPDDDLPGNDTQEKEERKNSKKFLFKDTTMEKDISKLLGGLRSSKEVLALSRLMVRCDTHAQRTLCLQVLKETTSQTRLKTFLQFHGLSIIWSWMVDITGVDDHYTSALKLEIINTLCILPITNKNIIEDSKVLPVVQRWAKPESDGKTSAEEESGAQEEENKDDRATHSDLEKEANKGEPTVTITSTHDDNVETKSDETPKETSSDEDGTNNKVSDDVKSNENFLSAAISLLDSWKDLREIYRIPKRQKPLTSPGQDSSSRDNSLSRTSSPLPKHSRTEEFDHKSYRVGRSRRDSSQERSRDIFDRSWDKYRDKRNDYIDNQFSPGSSHSGDNKKEAGRRKRRFSTDSDEYSQGSANLPWHCRTPRNNSKMSRQEYRRRFEKGVEKREQEKKRREEVHEAEMAQNVMYPLDSQQYIGEMVEDIPPLMDQDLSMVGQDMQGATFTPSGYSGNLIQINPTQPAQLMVEPYLNLGINQQLNIMPQVIQQTQNPFSAQVPVQANYDMSGMYSQDPSLQGMSMQYAMADPSLQNQQINQAGQQDPSLQVEMAMQYAIADPNLQNQQINQVGQQDPSLQVGMAMQYAMADPSLQNQQINQAGQQIVTNTVSMMQPQQTLQMQQQPQTALMQPQQPTSNNVTILGSQNGQAIVLLSAEQLQKLTQGDLSVLTSQPSQPEPSNAQSVTISSASKQNLNNRKQTKTKSSSGETSKDLTPKKLPPNWKTTTDPEGRTYYYHVISRQTQWDPPTWDGNEEDTVINKEAEMDLSSTPTHDERRLKSSKNKSDLITEEGKKAKEAFRLKMSQFVVQCLSAFRKPDRKVGRITSTEDFKHLARKLTHNVMQKEIKQVRVWEDLDFNANVKHKTKEYVKKYMSRVGPIYRIRDDNIKDIF